ncbi:MAG TPA: ATP-dependent helicase [Acidobacteriota bacterium]|nr:ATP-dependent helicase [Acidobacteriota bacterium]
MARKFVIPRRAGPGLDVDFEGDLNEQQYAAVSCGDGEKLVIAGAGTGKTRTLTYRVAWLLSRGVAADAILLVTFTNKAAREMVGRVRDLTNIETGRLWGGTFHSVGARVLRRHAPLLGFTDSFSILDEGDQRDLIRLCTTDVGVEVERRRFPSPRVLRSLISLQANSRTELVDLLAERFPRFLDWEDQIAAVCRRYAERKAAANAMDYDDLLAMWLRLLHQVPEVRRRYGQQLRYVLVDEYQDTNLIQGELVETLARENGGNLMVVGDDCQSIYSFRGAHYENILGFAERHPRAEVFKLEINYRSTPEILRLTNASIRCNTGQYRKELTARRSSGQQPALVPCNYPEQEAAFVAERILQLRDEGTSLNRIAVLYRAHAHRLSVETTLLRYDIPYDIRGGLRFFEQAHVKDVTVYLRLVDNPRDEVAFRRALMLQRGIGNVTANRLWEALTSAGSSDQLIDQLGSERIRRLLQRRARDSWDTFATSLQAVTAHSTEPEAAIRAVIDGGYDDIAAAQFTNYESRVEDLEQLAVFAAQYDSIGAFLEELVLLGELYGQDVRGGGERPDERVVLSTVHQAKGLEWDVVFVIHVAEGSLPSPRSLDEPGGEEEERRIFYVAMTRARDELYLSYPIVRPGGQAGTLLQQPSRFLQELPDTLLEPWEVFEAPSADQRGRSTPDSMTTAPSEAYDADDYDPNVDPLWNDEDYPQ